MRHLQPLIILFRLSRWKFWSYLAGPYLVGYTAGINNLGNLLQPWFWIHLIFFTFPANVLLYGVNDLFDTDTDSHNPKKSKHEQLLSELNRPLARVGAAVSLVISLMLVTVQRSVANSAVLLAFVVLAIAYSTPPIRLKARPILDSASNILYATPGFLGWQQASGRLVPPIAIFIAGLWTASMHLFSAIPDIQSDKKAGIKTTATVLGFRGSLIACALLWLGFFGFVVKTGVGGPLNLVLIIYPAIPLMLLSKPLEVTARVYWYFPIINSAVGMFAFFVVALSK